MNVKCVTELCPDLLQWASTHGIICMLGLKGEREKNYLPKTIDIYFNKKRKYNQCQCGGLLERIKCPSMIAVHGNVYSKISTLSILS